MAHISIFWIDSWPKMIQKQVSLETYGFKFM